MAKIRILALIILILGVVAGLYDAGEFLKFKDSNWMRPFRLGLDLKGGTHLVYRADVSFLQSSDNVLHSAYGWRGNP